MYAAVINSPIGFLSIQADDDQLVSVDFLDEPVRPTRPSNWIVKLVVEQIHGYFSDACFRFDIPYQLQGTDFQLSVWCALTRISVGSVLSYAELAEQLGTSPRAVGNACRDNPIPIVIPCHRIVAKHGLGGFAGQRSGKRIKSKLWLLRHEGCFPAIRRRKAKDKR